jgi:ribosomal protein S18 acetylase RimI-like enzyme
MTMELTPALTNKGFSLSDVEPSDFEPYFAVKKACYKKYVDEYFGGWVDETQRTMNTDAFNKISQETCFVKLLLHGSIVGFFAFDVQDDAIGGISIQMLECARNQGVGSFYLSHVISLANEQKKPIFLKVFQSNPAQKLYKRFGFSVYDKTNSHYLMRYDPE